MFTYINIFVYIHKYICLHINIFVTWSKYFLSSPSLCCTKRPREVSEWSFLKLYIKKIHKLFFVHLFNNILIIKTPCTKGVKTLQRRPYLENWCEPYKAVECGGTFVFLGQTVFLHPPPRSREDNKWKQIYCSIVSLYPLVLHPPCYVTRTN